MKQTRLLFELLIGVHATAVGEFLPESEYGDYCPEDRGALHRLARASTPEKTGKPRREQPPTFGVDMDAVLEKIEAYSQRPRASRSAASSGPTEHDRGAIFQINKDYVW